MLFGNFQIINIYIAKCLEKDAATYWNQSWMISSAVFVPAVVLQTKFHSPANFWEILGVCQRRLHMLCRPRESIRPVSSWKDLLCSVAGVRCWRPPVIGCQVTLFLFRSLCPCQESSITTVHRCCWTPTRVCAVTAHFNSLHQACSIQKARRAKLSTLICRGPQKSILFRCGDFVVVWKNSATTVTYSRSSLCNIFYSWASSRWPQQTLSRTVCCVDLVDMIWIDQWFSTGEELLPRVEF